MDEMVKNTRHTLDLVKRSMRYGNGRGMMLFFMGVLILNVLTYGNLVWVRFNFGLVLSTLLWVIGVSSVVLVGSNISYIRNRLSEGDLKWRWIAAWVIVTFLMAAFFGVGTMARVEAILVVGVMVMHMIANLGKENAKYNRTRLYRVK